MIIWKFESLKVSADDSYDDNDAQTKQTKKKINLNLYDLISLSEAVVERNKQRRKLSFFCCCVEIISLPIMSFIQGMQKYYQRNHFVEVAGWFIYNFSMN